MFQTQSAPSAAADDPHRHADAREQLRAHDRDDRGEQHEHAGRVERERRARGDRAPRRRTRASCRTTGTGCRWPRAAGTRSAGGTRQQRPHGRGADEPDGGDAQLARCAARSWSSAARRSRYARHVTAALLRDDDAFEHVLGMACAAGRRRPSAPSRFARSLREVARGPARRSSSRRSRKWRIACDLVRGRRPTRPRSRPRRAAR